MAGSLTLAPQKFFGRQHTVLAKCITDASGAVSGIDFEVQGGTLYAFAVRPMPGVSDLFDLTLKATTYIETEGVNIDWADILDGQGANLSNSTDGDWENLSAPFPLIPGMKLQPIIANGGNAQTIYLVLYIWEEVS